MRASALALSLIASVEICVSPARAQQGIYLPPAPQGPGGEDSIETASGTRCRQSINGNRGYLDVGVAGSASNGAPNRGTVFVSVTDRDNQALAYARVTVPIGKNPKRIDCSRLYELEIAKLKEEIELLRMNAE